MPKIPDYDSQVTPTTGGVAPGSFFLPNIHTDTGVQAAFTTLGAAGKSLENEGIREIGLATHEQRILEQGKAVAEGFRQQAQIESKYANYNSPDLPELLSKDLSDAKAQIIQNIDPRFQKYMDVHLDQQFSHTYATGIKNYNARVQQLNQAELIGSIREIAGTAAAAFESGDSGKYASALGNLQGLVTQVQGKLPGVAAKAGGVEAYTQQLIGEARRGILLKDNPAKVIELLKTPEGMKQLGVDYAHVDDVNRQAVTATHAQQNAVYDNVLKGFSQKQIPTPEQIRQLSGAQQMHIKNLLKGMDNEDNKATVLEFGDKVIRLNQDSPDAITSGRQLYNEISSSSGLSVGTKLQYMNSVMGKINGTQLANAKFDEQYLLDFQKMMTPDQHKLFLIGWSGDPNGAASVPPGTPVTDKIKRMNEFAMPYIKDSQDFLIQHSQPKKKGMVNIERVGAEFGEGTQNPQTYRAFNKRTGQYENVTKEQYDMIKGQK
jgi:hypothetical protein